ncbi:MAG: preprotein translocase subunit SecY [Halobacteria archaeon]
MGLIDALEPILLRMPSVRRPDKHVPFKKKLYWTAGVLVLYFALTNVTVFGVNVQGDLFGQFRSILAGAQGSILHLGIGPIVTASIVLQLLDGAEILPIDTQTPRGQSLYQGLQKFLVVVMSVLTAAPMVLSGFLGPRRILGLPLGTVTWIVFLQVVLGGILILYMDEIISKWGVGSGVGLFIIAGISQQLMGGIFDWHSAGGGGQVADLPTGLLFRWFAIFSGGYQPPFALSSSQGLWFLLTYGAEILFVFTTIAIFVVVVYAESVRVEIPLSHSRVKGARGRYPVKLIYASVLPLIFVRAIQANIQMIGQILATRVGMPAWFGVYSQGQAVSGLMYYLTPIRSPRSWMWWLPTGPSQDAWQVLLRLLVDAGFLIIGGAIFAVFWVKTADMGPDAVARQIQNSGMQIPGFRRNPGIIEKVMDRYIPHITVLGGIILGILALMANLLGTIGNVSGTGLLLTISITYKLYEEIAEEQLMNMHPMMRKMFGD